MLLGPLPRGWQSPLNLLSIQANGRVELHRTLETTIPNCRHFWSFGRVYPLQPQSQIPSSLLPCVRCGVFMHFSVSFFVLVPICTSCALCRTCQPTYARTLPQIVPRRRRRPSAADLVSFEPNPSSVASISDDLFLSCLPCSQYVFIAYVHNLLPET